MIVALVVGVLVVMPAAAQTDCVNAEDRERVRTIMLDAVDAGLKRHTTNLFDNLLKDRGDQPDRMTRGMRGGIRLYLRSRAAALRWSPPICDR